MNDRFSAQRPASWLGRARGMFNLNDPRWGRGDEPTGQDDARPDDQPRRPTEPQRPAEPPRGGGGGGRGPNQGPPDLDELWRDFNRKLSGLFGGRGGRGSGSGGGGYQPPDM